MDRDKVTERIEDVAVGDSITIRIETRTKQIVPRNWSAGKTKRMMKQNGSVPLLDVPKEKAEESTLQVTIKRTNEEEYEVLKKGKGFIPWLANRFSSLHGVGKTYYQSPQQVTNHIVKQVAKLETTTFTYVSPAFELYQWAKEQEEQTESIWST